jgi:hypothetical protein
LSVTQFHNERHTPRNVLADILAQPPIFSGVP